MDKIQIMDTNGVLKTVNTNELDFYIAAYGAVIHNDEILILPMKDKFGFPGGGISKGEDHKSALVREILEETGYQVKPTKLLNVYTMFFQSFKNGAYMHSIQIYYICEIAGETATQPRLTDREKTYLKPAVWKKLSQLDKSDFLGTPEMIDDIMGYCADTIK